jgi:hypothetical protein
MKKNMPISLALFAAVLATLACSLSGLQQGASTVKQTSVALQTDVSGIVSQGSSLIKTAQALETEHPGIIGTVKAVATQGAPLLSTLEGVGTNSPGLVQTAQAAFQNEIPTGEPPADVPIFNRNEAQSFIGYSQYIFYISPNPYQDVLQFYTTEMPNNGWQYQENESHEYANAAQLNYTKDNRTASVNLSINPLNNTTAVVINLTVK